MRYRSIVLIEGYGHRGLSGSTQFMRTRGDRQRKTHKRARWALSARYNPPLSLSLCLFQRAHCRIGGAHLSSEFFTPKTFPLFSVQFSTPFSSSRLRSQNRLTFARCVNSITLFTIFPAYFSRNANILSSFIDQTSIFLSFLIHFIFFKNIISSDSIKRAFFFLLLFILYRTFPETRILFLWTRSNEHFSFFNISLIEKHEYSFIGRSDSIKRAFSFL